MMEIVQMGLKHIPQIAELEKLCFSDPWSSLAFHSELNNPLSLWLVAVDPDGNVLGYIGSQTVMDSSDVMNVAIRPNVRRQGIGSALILKLCDALRQKQVSELLLEVRQSNLSAIALYKKLQFQPIGRRKNYYRNPKEDAIIFRKEIQ